MNSTRREMRITPTIDLSKYLAGNPNWLEQNNSFCLIDPFLIDRKRKREFKKLRKAVIKDKNASKTQIFENMQGREVVAPRFQRITRMKAEKYEERVLFALNKPIKPIN